jgi:predicted DNA-binding protein (UPF0251 family)
MPRPVKLRQVAFAPGATFFKPAGVPMRMLEDVTVTIEEVEAIRLKDIEDLHQEECAKEMGISRGTFHQILKSAHGKLADAIVDGKAIRVEGGNFAFPGARFRCRHDGHEWALPPGPLPGASSVACPSCNGRDVQPLFYPRGLWPGGHGRGSGHGHGPGGWGRGRWEGPWGPPGPDLRRGMARGRQWSEESDPRGGSEK